MFYKHLFSITAAVLMTAATFGSIEAYATSLAVVGRAPAETSAAAEIDAQLRLALQETQRKVLDNVADEAIALLPTLTVATPSTLVARR